jgi:hypothetical protein
MCISDEPLVPGPFCCKFEISFGKLRTYKSPGSDQIPAELLQVGGETLLSAIEKLVNSI